MRITETAQERSFRAEVQDFARSELPQDIREKVLMGEHLDRPDYERWYRRLEARGWMCPNWPVAHGGTGWSLAQRMIFDETLLACGAPRMVASGVIMLGPVLIKFGTPEQQALHLPSIRRTEVWWAQGFSEPGAGSDLASLRCRAERDGDDYVVTGQKIWTSYAQFSNWMFCLVRTSDAGKPQEGISFLLVDMKTPGLTVRPIRTIDGGHDLNEVFFDQVRVPVAHRIGEENKGWTYAKALLDFERGGIAGVGAARQSVARVHELLRRRADAEGAKVVSPSLQGRLRQLEIDLMALEATNARLLGTGKPPRMEEVSMLKCLGTELRQSVHRLQLDVAGEEGASLARDAFGLDAELHGLTPSYLDARKFSIYGGTNEIQRNLVARALFQR
jgi:alkylation response protein AidB-like acyl-CoA dehydrogenase